MATYQSNSNYDLDIVRELSSLGYIMKRLKRQTVLTLQGMAHTSNELFLGRIPPETALMKLLELTSRYEKPTVLRVMNNESGQNVGTAYACYTSKAILDNTKSYLNGYRIKDDWVLGCSAVINFSCVIVHDINLRISNVATLAGVIFELGNFTKMYVREGNQTNVSLLICYESHCMAAIGKRHMEEKLAVQLNSPNCEVDWSPPINEIDFRKYIVGVETVGDRHVIYSLTELDRIRFNVLQINQFENGLENCLNRKHPVNLPCQYEYNIDPEASYQKIGAFEILKLQRTSVRKNLLPPKFVPRALESFETKPKTPVNQMKLLQNSHEFSSRSQEVYGRPIVATRSQPPIKTEVQERQDRFSLSQPSKTTQKENIGFADSSYSYPSRMQPLLNVEDRKKTIEKEMDGRNNLPSTSRFVSRWPLEEKNCPPSSQPAKRWPLGENKNTDILMTSESYENPAFSKAPGTSTRQHSMYPQKAQTWENNNSLFSQDPKMEMNRWKMEVDDRNSLFSDPENGLLNKFTTHSQASKQENYNIWSQKSSQSSEGFFSQCSQRETLEDKEEYSGIIPMQTCFDVLRKGYE